MIELHEHLQKAKTGTFKEVMYPAIAEVKYDGVRAFLTPDNKFFARSGKEIVLPNTSANINTMSNDFIVDMEITLATGKTEERSTVIGLINSAMKGGTIDELQLHFRVFDMLPYEHFAAKYCGLSLIDRTFLVSNFVAMNQHLNFHEPECCAINSVQGLKDYLEALYTDGYEGAVVKMPNSLYAFGKRDRSWLRFKQRKTADLKCVAVVLSEKGQFEGLIGALMLEGVVEGKDVVVKVGSGLTAYDRTLDYEDFIDETIEIEYSHVTQDSKTKKYSLNQPTFKFIRGDK